MNLHLKNAPEIRLKE